MPVMPDERLIKNFDKRSSQQFYVPEVCPKDIHKKSPKEIRDFAERQWHRRMNGEWQFIKGTPYFIPGGAIPFFDCWVLENGQKAQFRYSALTLFWLFYNYVEPNPNIFGIFDMKTRRIGDTANMMHILYERTTRFKGVRGGLQSYKDTMASKTFGRIAKAHRNMPYYFRPNRSGSDREYLAFMPPNEVSTMKKLREKDDIGANTIDSEFLGSFMDYEATSTGAYDGEQLFTVMVDEIFKIPPHRMNVIEQWKNLRRCLSLFGEDVIYGKGLLLSTVEKKDTENPETLSTVEVAEWFWENSDPNDVDDNNRTASGLVRVFRGFEDAAKVDQWGFPQKARAAELRNSKLKKAMEKNDMSSVHDIYRKEPASPEEALIEDNANCPLYPEICQTALHHIKNGLDKYGNPIPDYRLPYTEGELIWRNGKPNTEVIFVPRPGGPWHVSQLPERPNNVIPKKMAFRDEYGTVQQGITFDPRNAATTRIGADPISANPRLVSRGSEGAIVVERRLDLGAESSALIMDEHGVAVNPEIMVSNQPIADYLGRPHSPDKYFDEIVKACFFWGAPVMLEVDKYEAYAYMLRLGYFGFIMYEPDVISRKRGRSSRPAQGVRSSADVVAMYVTSLQMYIANYWPCIKHPRLLHQASRFIPAKRTKFDSVVAWGMAKIANEDNRYQKEEPDTIGWSVNPFEHEGV